MINIIIPCYYSSQRIRPCFESLATQTKKDQIKVFMVNDCSPNTDCDYLDIRNEFKDKLNIAYLKTPVNGGPGKARQYGLENIDNDFQYVMFIDDDDKLENDQVIENYLNEISKKKSNEMIGFIAAERIHVKNGERIFADDFQYSGLTGSIFNYSAIQIMNLKFNESKYDEDSLFLLQYIFYISFLNRYFYKENISYIIKNCESFKAYSYTSDNEESLTHIVDNNKKDLSVLWIADEMCKMFEQLNDYRYKNIIDQITVELQTYYFTVSFFTQYFHNQELNVQEYNYIYTVNKRLLQLIDKTEITIDKDYGISLYQYYNSTTNFNAQHYSILDYKKYLDNLYSKTNINI